MAVARAQTGAAGEFYVAAQLSQRGWAASLLLGNADRTDLLAQHAVAGVTIAVQVKAANGDGPFQAGVKAEQVSPPGAREWFVFVALNEPHLRPTYYVVPRNVVAAFVWASYRRWISGARPDGRPRQATSMRSIPQRELRGYRECWDDLLEDPDAMPYRLTDWFWSSVEAVGLPPTHPGICRQERLPAEASG